jgi:hypothetical protein
MIEQHHNFLLPTILVLATILLIFGMKYMSGGRLARKQFADDDTFRLLAEKATEVQSAMALSLTAAQTELADVRTRLSSIEKILRDVG